MKFKIVKNEARKTVTVIVTPVIFGYTDYLFEKYEGERYFATGVLKEADYQKDVIPFANALVEALNDIAKDTLPSGVKFGINDVLTLKDDEYRLLGRNLDKDKKWDKQFKINLSSKSKEVGKVFLFEDLAQNKPIKKEDGWKHFYAIELEIGAGYSDEELDKYVFSVFHRAISVGRRKSETFAKNNDAWSGFDLGVQEDNDLALDVKDDDMPF